MSSELTIASGMIWSSAILHIPSFVIFTLARTKRIPSGPLEKKVRNREKLGERGTYNSHEMEDARIFSSRAWRLGFFLDFERGAAFILLARIILLLCF